MNIPIQKESGEFQEQILETDNLDEITFRHIRKVLRKTNGKIHGPGGAAELLGIKANTLRNRMNKLGIKYKRSKN
ncbi:MAG: hypothetical protein JRD05_00085 [Deltaproteobacteria bacterium]|nr:hypothetical protein [Deltaproteobacteria bacterium]